MQGHVFVMNERIEELVHDVATFPSTTSAGWRSTGSQSSENRPKMPGHCVAGSPVREGS